MKGVVVSGGNKIREDILEKYCENSYVICCDGGIKNFYNSQVLPDIVVGDFDSIDDEGKNLIKEKNIKIKTYNPIKNYTDTEIALNMLLENKYDEIIILAATGTRMDHTVANIFYLQKLYGKVNSFMVDNHNLIFYVEKGKYTFQRNNYKYISMISISEEMTYSTNGMKYEVDNLKISTSELKGISNEIVDTEAIITVHNGRGFIIRSID